MDCDDALLRMYQYLDGEITVWRRRAITARPARVRIRIRNPCVFLRRRVFG